MRNIFRLSLWGFVCLATWSSMAQQSAPGAATPGAVPNSG